MFQVLVSNGLFPTSPSRPRMAISINLLDFYNALFQQSCDAINAMASALNSHYTQCGFVLLDTKVFFISFLFFSQCWLWNIKDNPVQDAFRRGLGYAIQWYDSLKILVERSVKEALRFAEQLYQDLQATPHTAITPLTTQLSIPDNIPDPTKKPSVAVPNKLSKAECARILQDHCPACFGGNLFGRPWIQYVPILFSSLISWPSSCSEGVIFMFRLMEISITGT